MNFQNVSEVFSSLGCLSIYSKELAPNDNSKNQVYVAGSFDVLNIFPIKEIITDSSGTRKVQTFKASLNFYWILDDGTITEAPKTQFILYPEYPEVRLSGFLSGCKNAPSELMSTRLVGRILLLGVNSDAKVFAYVAAPDSSIANWYRENKIAADVSVFQKHNLREDNSRLNLINKLTEIHLKGWTNSVRLNSDGNIVDCNAPQCGGYTLEAHLGIKPNGFAEPDFEGWEVKQFGVKDFYKLNSSVITLMTPEPTGGYYTDKGVDFFLHKYGYADKRGREDRINFGGIFKSGVLNNQTGLTMNVIGFDPLSCKITNASEGRIALVDKAGNDAASWSFSSLIKHWNRKHNQACYVPSRTRTQEIKQYSYGSNVLMGDGTDFFLFLNQLAQGNIYYDPAVKMENVSSNGKIKRRSQFRIKSSGLHGLYHRFESLSLIK
jgi:hypothetical protein